MYGVRMYLYCQDIISIRELTTEQTFRSADYLQTFQCRQHFVQHWNFNLKDVHTWNTKVQQITIQMKSSSSRD